MNATLITPVGPATVAVVIPYFQREPGVLRRALASIFAQTNVSATTILVIDDSSPLSAHSEVQLLAPEQRGAITIIRQANAGPGAARNRGLDSVPEKTEFVAFLDSDDEWLPDHLYRATSALAHGHDFYFTSHYDIDDTTDSFTRRNLLMNERAHPIASLQGAYSYRGDLTLEILERCPIETSTVVFRRRAFRNLRFRTEFRDAYEDLVFWFDAAQLSRPVAFSARPEARYGRGVNVFRGVTTGSDASLRRIVAATRFRAYAKRHARLSPTQVRAVRDRIRLSRRHFVAEIIHRLRNGPTLRWHPISLQLRADPLSALLFVPEAARQLIERAFRTAQNSGEAR